MHDISHLLILVTQNLVPLPHAEESKLKLHEYHSSLSYTQGSLGNSVPESGAWRSATANCQHPTIRGALGFEKTEVWCVCTVPTPWL